MRNALNRVLISYVGPFPINPFLAFIFAFAFYFAHVNGLFSEFLGDIELILFVPIALFLSVILGLLAGFMAYFIERFQLLPKRSLMLYILEIFCISTILTFTSRFFSASLSKYFEVDLSEIWQISAITFFINVPVYLIVLSLLHQSEKLINSRLQTADSKVTKLKSERRVLIKSDEEIRRQVAQYLHDRVQSELMVAVIQLKSLSDKSEEEREFEIESIFKRLERLRSVDLSKLAQILAPNFTVGGLMGSLGMLIHQYSNNFDTNLTLDPNLSDLEESSMLGIYRIIEQALLNTITHGPAFNVAIKIELRNSKMIHLSVKDDGPGSDSSHVGVGTTIIDSWVDLMSGSKSINTGPGQGYELNVELKIEK
jgi:signal transduction histidine kinase